MTFGNRVLEFYNNLQFPMEILPEGIHILNPLDDMAVKKYNREFYSKFYNDPSKRLFLIGINPGRFGGGVTGIPFTDPVHLSGALGIKNGLKKQHELSSRFIYQVVEAFGGPHTFFGRCYLTAVSPLGFVFKGKNINYYDHSVLREKLEPYIINWMDVQVNIGSLPDIAFSLGSGENFKYLNRLNQRYKWFNEIEALPHPRWVMQYRYPRQEEFVRQYLKKISKFL